MLEWRYARASDIDRYYGERPHTTLNAIVALLDGEPVGVIGISREGNTGLYFSEYKPELNPRCITAMRAVKASVELVRNYPLPVLAASKTEEGNRLLRRLGFVPVTIEILERMGLEPVDDETHKWIWPEQH